MYKVVFHKERVSEYLDDPDRLTDAGRKIIFNDFDRDFLRFADSYLTSDVRRTSPGSKHFGYDIVFIDPESGKLRSFWFAISDERAKESILQVDYVEETDPEEAGWI